LAVTRDAAKNILVDVEFMKDGEGSGTIVSAFESLDIGLDEDGEPITSCVVVEAEMSVPVGYERAPKLTKNDNTYLEMVRDHQPINTEQLNDKLREIGIGVKRPADLVDIRKKLKRLGLIYEGMNGWSCA
jgi:hypothetical protein